MKKLLTIGLALLAAFIVFLLFKPFTIIQPGYRGVVVRLGQVKEGILSEGIHYYTPLISHVEKIDTRVQKEEVEGEAGSQDLQVVKFRVAVNYHLDPDQVNKIVQQIGTSEVYDRVIIPAVQEGVKSASAKFTAEQLLTQRPRLKEEIDTALSERLKQYNVVLDDVSITNVEFSDDFNRAIESKVTAQQKAQEELNNLERTKAQAQSTIERAKAEAETIRIQAEAINKQGGRDYVQLKWIEKWNGQLPSVQLSSGATPLITLPDLVTTGR